MHARARVCRRLAVRQLVSADWTGLAVRQLVSADWTGLVVRQLAGEGPLCKILHTLHSVKILHTACFGHLKLCILPPLTFDTLHTTSFILKIKIMHTASFGI